MCSWSNKLECNDTEEYHVAIETDKEGSDTYLAIKAVPHIESKNKNTDDSMFY